MKDIKSNVTEVKENWEKEWKRKEERKKERDKGRKLKATLYHLTPVYFFPILNSPLADLCLNFVFNVP